MLTTILPFSLWTAPEGEHKAYAAQMTQTSLPHLSRWLKQAHCVHRQVLPEHALISAHERAQAQAQGWLDVPDGLLPQAAQIAQTLGLSCEPDEGWALLSWCHWQVSSGQVILCDPQDLELDEATDRQLFALIQPFFAEDGVSLHPYRPGHWLAKSKAFLNLPTASLERVIGRNINAWLIGGEQPSAAAQWVRRLQNEMQMLLYTHEINAHRGTSINSFWLHGTGNLLPHASSAEVQIHNDLRHSALQHDFLSWLHAWQTLDARLFASEATAPQRLVLCGDDVWQVYQLAQRTLWQKLRQHLSPLTLARVLLTPTLSD